MRQVELLRPSKEGIYEKVVWIPAKFHVQEGTQLTGKDGIAWTVNVVYYETLDMDDIHSDWKVGGLT